MNLLERTHRGKREKRERERESQREKRKKREREREREKRAREERDTKERRLRERRKEGESTVTHNPFFLFINSENYRTARAKIQRVDWRFDFGVAQHDAVDVDQQE